MFAIIAEAGDDGGGREAEEDPDLVGRADAIRRAARRPNMGGDADNRPQSLKARLTQDVGLVGLTGMTALSMMRKRPKTAARIGRWVAASSPCSSGRSYRARGQRVSNSASSRLAGRRSML